MLTIDFYDSSSFKQLLTVNAIACSKENERCWSPFQREGPTHVLFVPKPSSRKYVLTVKLFYFKEKRRKKKQKKTNCRIAYSVLLLLIWYIRYNRSFCWCCCIQKKKPCLIAFLFLHRFFYNPTVYVTISSIPPSIVLCMCVCVYVCVYTVYTYYYKMCTIVLT